MAAFVAVVAGALLASAPVRGRVAAPPTIHVQASPTGQLAINAREVPIVDALNAIANEVGFAVSVYQASRRPTVNLTLPMSPVKRVVRELLRGRNYALVYDTDTNELMRVILLAPGSSSPSRRAPVRRRPLQRGRATRGKPKGAIVVSR